MEQDLRSQFQRTLQLSLRFPDIKVFAEIENTDTKTRIRKNIKESGYGFELTEGNYIYHSNTVNLNSHTCVKNVCRVIYFN